MGYKEAFSNITTVYKHNISAKVSTLAYSFLTPDDKSRVFHFGIAAIPARQRLLIQKWFNIIDCIDSSNCRTDKVQQNVLTDSYQCDIADDINVLMAASCCMGYFTMIEWGSLWSCSIFNINIARSTNQWLAKWLQRIYSIIRVVSFCNGVKVTLYEMHV